MTETSIKYGIAGPQSSWVRTSVGALKVMRYVSRGVYFNPTTGNPRNVTHLSSGMKAAADVSCRLAEILCVVYDRLLPGELTCEQLTEKYDALPLEVRNWMFSFTMFAKEDSK